MTDLSLTNNRQSDDSHFRGLFSGYCGGTLKSFDTQCSLVQVSHTFAWFQFASLWH